MGHVHLGQHEAMVMWSHHSWPSWVNLIAIVLRLFNLIAIVLRSFSTNHYFRTNHCWHA